MKSRRIHGSAGPTAIMPKDEAPAESRGRNNAQGATAPTRTGTAYAESPADA
jgi:hypothetical protein